MARIIYREARSRTFLWVFMALMAALVVTGLSSAWYMEHHGHIVTGMNNGIVWGLPHVFAIFLIVAASGILNMASLASVFGKTTYKPKARLSGLMSIALLVGGLSVLVLDLGRPDRLTVAMTSYNFKSIFAWNIFLYTGFIVIVGAYLIVQMTRSWMKWTGAVGTFAFVWRLILTTGTGSIFGWLVAREAFNAAMLAPLFIAMSLSLGLAIFITTRLLLDYGCGDRSLGTELIERLAKLLGIFIATTLYFQLLMHLTNLYSAARGGVERFLLVEGGIYPLLFWGGFVILGSLIPMALVFLPAFNRNRMMVGLASVLVIAGGLASIYVIVIGGQAFPLNIFPGMEVSSSFGDGQIQHYVPSLPELLLGIGGWALAALITLVGVKILPILPVEDNVTLNAAAAAG
ncbi:MAG: polysulfide reductase NrfD [Nitratireductor sp.]|nr:polysulfide reductase NrfD [Nitratireductor sp.]MCC0020952.1 polysulfide reductase NrfD [Nitratireductor sp.]